MTKKRNAKTGTVHFITTKTFFPDIFFLLVTVRVEKSFWGQNSHGVLFCFFPFVYMLINITRYMTIVDDLPNLRCSKSKNRLQKLKDNGWAKRTN